MLSYYHLIGIVVFLINTQFSFISCAAPAPLTQAQKLAWLNDHNSVRCDANAVTMPALIWDDALEKTAQEYVNTCPSGHNANRQSRYVFYSGLTNIPGVGENYAAGYQTALAVDAAWASEKPSMGGHYTQMVWATTTRVGCALNNVSCGGYGTYWICDYYPPGNYIGQQPFTPGGTAGSTEACQKKSRTDFPVMVWNNGVGTVVDGLNGGTTTTQVPTQAPTQAPTTRAPTTAPTPAPTQAPTQPPTQAPTQAPTVAPTTPTPTTPAPTPVWQSFAGYDSYPGQNAAVLSGTTAFAAQSYAQSRSYPGFVLCSNTAYFRAASQSPGLTAQSLYTNRVSNGGCTLYIYAVAGSLTSSI